MWCRPASLQMTRGFAQIVAWLLRVSFCVAGLCLHALTLLPIPVATLTDLCRQVTKQALGATSPSAKDTLVTVCTTCAFHIYTSLPDNGP